jgi:hypothetical protein
MRVIWNSAERIREKGLKDSIQDWRKVSRFSGICENLFWRTSTIGAERTILDSDGVSEGPEKSGERLLAKASVAFGDRKRSSAH